MVGRATSVGDRGRGSGVDLAPGTPARGHSSEPLSRQRAECGALQPVSLEKLQRCRGNLGPATVDHKGVAGIGDLDDLGDVM